MRDILSDIFNLACITGATLAFACSMWAIIHSAMPSAPIRNGGQAAIFAEIGK